MKTNDKKYMRTKETYFSSAANPIVECELRIRICDLKNRNPDPYLYFLCDY